MELRGSEKHAYIALGSNMGDRRRTLELALELLEESDGVRLLRRSTWHETAPVGGAMTQGDFLNGTCEVLTRLTPEELLARCQEIESVLGRVRNERNGPRTADLDLLWYEGEERDGEELTLPHPRWEERAFVLAPLAELAPEFVLPECQETVADRAASLSGVECLG